LVRERSHGDDARAARPVVDHESSAEKLAELLAQLTHHDVERRAGAGPTQQPHRSRGIGVCSGGGRRREQRERRRSNDTSNNRCHGVLLF